MKGCDAHQQEGVVQEKRDRNLLDRVDDQEHLLVVVGYAFHGQHSAVQQ